MLAIHHLTLATSACFSQPDPYRPPLDFNGFLAGEGGISRPYPSQTGAGPVCCSDQALAVCVGGRLKDDTSAYRIYRAAVSRLTNGQPLPSPHDDDWAPTIAWLNLPPGQPGPGKSFSDPASCRGEPFDPLADVPAAYLDDARVAAVLAAYRPETQAAAPFFYALGQALLKPDRRGKPHWEAAAYWFRRGAALKNADAANALGEILEQGHLGKPDRSGAYDAFRLAWKRRHPRGACNLGRMLLAKAERQADPEARRKALAMLAFAAENGVEEARRRMADADAAGGVKG
ncbi:MAG: tetratricopeptide repeat protein [Opitutales bacterium]